MAGDLTHKLDIIMPRMGLTMEEGTVISWFKQPGQQVKNGEPLLEIETDKAAVEIESPGEGVLSQIILNPGETAPVGAVIGILTPSQVPAGQNLQTTESLTIQPLRSAITNQADQQLNSLDQSGKVRASPAARKLARLHNVDLSRLQGSGPGHRIVAWNVTAAKSTGLPEGIQTGQPTSSTGGKISPLAQRVAAELRTDISAISGSGPGGRVMRQDVELIAKRVDEIEVTPFTRQHKIMAERMSASFRSAPHFYLHVEVDARQLVTLRQSLLVKLQERFQVHLTYSDLLVKFCGSVLKSHPQIMSYWSEKGLVPNQNINIGLAMDTLHGLVVPVIPDADQIGLVEIARTRVELSERAKAGKLLPQDLESGVFTITNLGMYGIDSFDAILNPPQAAILAVGRIREKPIAENGQIFPAPIINLSLSVDHRVLDGAAAARFLSDLVEAIETPGMVLK